jgi:DNA-directed RNA polymerase alpha subunit
MELIVEKGIGKTHAKWSPVSTAYYRLVPEITFKQDITGEDAVELKKLCPTGVFDIEDLGGKKGCNFDFLTFYRKSSSWRCEEVHNMQGMREIR